MLRLVIRLLPALALLAVGVAFFASGVASDFSLAALSAHEQSWRAAAALRPALSLAVYVVAYALLTAAGLPVAMMLTVAGGVIFGPIAGAFAAISAATVAAVAGYGAARSAAGAFSGHEAADPEGRLRRLVQALRSRAFWPILTARLSPVVPFGVINVAAGLARVPLVSFVGATVLGGLPSSFIYASLGAGVGAGLSAGTLDQAVRSPHVWGPLLALSLVSLAPLFVARRRKTAEVGRDSG